VGVQLKKTVRKQIKCFRVCLHVGFSNAACQVSKAGTQKQLPPRSVVGRRVFLRQVNFHQLCAKTVRTTSWSVRIRPVTVIGLVQQRGQRVSGRVPIFLNYVQ